MHKEQTESRPPQSFFQGIKIHHLFEPENKIKEENNYIEELEYELDEEDKQFFALVILHQ